MRKEPEKVVNQIECISLCEILEHIYKIEPCYEKMVEKINQVAGYSECRRIYIGSSFCGQYFLNLSPKHVNALISFCKQEDMKVTLVLPVFTQKHLLEGKNKLKTLLNQYKGIIDEVTVNDYGMLYYMASTYPNVRLNMGRLFMKDYREPRYEEYFNETLKPKGFTNYLNQVIKRYTICGIEFDPTHRKIDFSEKPESIEIGIYEPYSYITVGQICEVGSISKSIEKKFRPNEPCGVECYRYRMQYHMEDGRDWRRVGRAVYFENKNPELIGLQQVRRIYAPLDWEVES